jgi:hypothetical protein
MDDFQGRLDSACLEFTCLIHDTAKKSLFVQLGRENTRGVAIHEMNTLMKRLNRLFPPGSNMAIEFIWTDNPTCLSYC